MSLDIVVINDLNKLTAMIVMKRHHNVILSFLSMPVGQVVQKF